MKAISCGDGLRSHLLFREAFAECPGGIGVVENMVAGFELHFVFRNRECPRSEGVHEAAFEIEESNKASAIFSYSELAAELPTIYRKAEGILGATFGGGFALCCEALRGDRGFINGRLA